MGGTHKSLFNLLAGRTLCDMDMEPFFTIPLLVGTDGGLQEA